MAEFQCPKCKENDKLEVVVKCWATLHFDGENIQTDVDTSHDGSHEWDDNSRMSCRQCGHSDTVGAFRPDGGKKQDKDDQESGNVSKKAREEAIKIALDAVLIRADQWQDAANIDHVDLEEVWESSTEERQKMSDMYRGVYVLLEGIQ